MTERDLHKAVLAFFRSTFDPDQVVYHHTANEAAGKAGWRGREPGALKGFADWMLLWRDVTDAGKVGFIELKAEGKYPSPEQKWFLETMRQHGHMRAVCRSLEDVEGTLTAWGVPMKGRVSA